MIETNKKDFEKALDTLKDNIVNLDNVIHDNILKELQEVVDEYEGHFESDIQELMDERDELQDLVDKLENN